MTFPETPRPAPWSAAQARDWVTFAACVHPEVVYRVPQTCEIVRGLPDYVEFNATCPGDWAVQLVSVAEAPGQAVSRTVFTVGGDTVTGFCFFEIRDGLITEIDDFWPEAYEPPQRVTTVVQRY